MRLVRLDQIVDTVFDIHVAPLWSLRKIGSDRFTLFVCWQFESVRRRNAFSNGKTKTTNDPYSSLERKVSNRDKEDNHRRSIRVILRNSTPLNQTDSTIDGSLHQTHVTPPHEVHTVRP